MRKPFRKLFIILSMIFALPCIGRVFASNQYIFDDQIFSGDFAVAKDTQADVFFHRNGNSFWGKLFFQDLKTIATTHIALDILHISSIAKIADDEADKLCNKQIRGFYINSARGNRVRPLDEDSLFYLRSIDASYNNLVLTGGLFVCSTPANGIYGYIQHTWSGETYSLMAWTQYDFAHNIYIELFDVVWSLVFENALTQWYLRDSYGGIAEVSWSWLNVSYVCGDGLIEDTELCDDGANNGNLNYCNDTCNGTTTSICGDAIVQTGYEVCDEWSGLNGQVGHCNYTCNDIIPVPVPPHTGWWGWGGWGASTDLQQWLCGVRDCSDSYYDGMCGTCTAEDIEHHKVAWPQGLLINTPDAFSGEVHRIQTLVWSRYSLEFVQAYVFAKDVGITTMVNMDQAYMTWTLLRAHMAKMLVNYAVKIMDQKPDINRQCVFSDVNDSSVEMQWYSRLACQLGLMWLKKDGTPDTKFTPDGIVTRAQFGTVLSRLLYGDAYNNWSWVRYAAHLNALKTASIMTKISVPTMDELRGYVMIMLMRVAQK